MAGTISFSGLSASGIDSSAWVDALVSTKQQTITTLQEEKEAQENLLSIVNDIKSYFSSFQSCLSKLTDAQYGIPTMDLFLQNLAVSSNTNIATATATVEAARQSYDVLVDQLATATKANSGYVQYEVKRATLDTQLGILGVTNGTVTVNSQSFSITTEDTIKDLINKFDSVGVSANFDEEKGVFTVGVGIDEIDEGATNLKSALKLSDNNIDGAVSGSLVYVTRDTEFSKLGLTGGRIVIEDKDYLIVKDGDEYTISDGSGVEYQMNTVGDFFDYLMSSAVNAEEATVDDKGNIVIKGAKIDSVEFGSNLLEVLNLTETNDRTVMESQELSYNKDHVADLTTQLSSLGITDTKTLVVGGTTHNITSDKTLGDIKELLNANGVEFNIDDKGVITVDTKGNEISGTLLDALGLDPTKGGSTITSTPHLATLQATGDTLLSDLGVDDSMSYVAYKSDGTALTATISGLSNKTVDELIADLKAQGVNASFDSVNHQILIDDGYIEGSLADQLGMNKTTTTYTESATLNTTLEKLGSTGNETLTIDGGSAITYGKDTTLQTILDDITAAGGNVTFKDGNVTISGVTLGGSIPGLLGLEATTQGSTVTSGELTIVTGSSSSGGDLDETVEYDITLSSKIGDILGTTNNYTLTVEDGSEVTYTKDTTLQTLKNQIEAEGGIFRINEDNTITIDGVTMSGTLVGALGFESVENGTRFSTVNPVMVQGASNVATGGTTLGQLGLGSSASIATFGVTPMASPASLTLSIDGGAEITYDSTTTLDDIFADIQAAGGTAYIDSEGYMIVEGVNLSGTLVDALGLQVTSYGSTITSGNIQVATSTTSTSSSELVAEGKGDITWDSTIGSITDETISYSLSINGNSVVYDADTKLSEIKTAIENAGGTMAINSDNTITINGVSASGSLMDALGFDVTDYKTTISSNMPIYALGEDQIADESTTFDELGIDSSLRDYTVYLPDGTVVKSSSTDGTSGTKTIGDWLNKVNSALNSANGTSGVDYAQINNGVITITGGYVDGSLPTALGIGKETVVTDVTLSGQGIQYIEYDPLEYISAVRVQDGESAKDVSHNGSIGVNATESGTASSDISSSGLIGPEDEFIDLFGNITDATLDATLAELLTPGASDPLNNDARLPASSYTLKIGNYAEKTFNSATTTLRDVIDYVDELKSYDPTYDIAFDAYLSGDKLVIKADAAITGTLADVLGLTKVNTEDEYYTYVAKSVKYTDLVEGGSNGYNFSVVGTQVEYEKDVLEGENSYEYEGGMYTEQVGTVVQGAPSRSAKLVDLFGNDVIGKTVIVEVTQGYHSSGEDRPIDGGIGGNNMLPADSIDNMEITHVQPNEASTKTYTIDANTTISNLCSWADFGTQVTYDSDTGELVITESNWTDGCGGNISGTFYSWVGADDVILDSSPITSDARITKKIYKMPEVDVDTTVQSYAKTTSTISSLFEGSTSSRTLTINDGSGDVDLTFSSSDTVQTIINKLATYGITAKVIEPTGLSLESQFFVESDKCWTFSGELAKALFGESTSTVKQYSGSTLSYTKTTSQEIIYDASTKLSSIDSYVVGKRIWVASDDFSGDPMGIYANSTEFSFLEINSNTTIDDVINFLKFSFGISNVYYNTNTGDLEFNVREGYDVSSNGMGVMKPALNPDGSSTGGYYFINFSRYESQQTTYTANVDTTMKDIFDSSSSQSFSVTVNGSTSTISLSSSDTVSSLLAKFGNIGLSATFDNNKLVVSGSNFSIENNSVTKKLFGGYFPTQSTVGEGAHIMDQVSTMVWVTKTFTLDASTVIGDLFGDSNNHTFTVNGEDITLGSSNTIQDLIDKLADKGVTATVTDGEFLIGSNGYSLTISGDLANKILGKSGSSSVTVDYDTREVTLSTSSRMEDIFWDDSNHTFVINKASGGSTTITLGKNDTIQTLINELKSKGIAATIDSSGKMTFKSNYKWSASGDLADLITGGSSMSMSTTYLYTYETEELEVYTGHQTVSQMLNAGESLVNGFRYHIASAEDLKALATFVNERGQDTTDIDFVLDGNITLNSSFVSIGTSSNAFKGNFHGNGYTISGAQDTIFAYTSDAEIKDVGVINANVSGGDYTGILIGKGSNTKINNVYVTGSVSGSSNTGALAGSLTGSTVTDSYSNATVSGSSSVGGFVGSTTSTNITRAYATGDVTASGSKVGGFVGNHASGTITAAYATGNVKANSTVGGFVGSNSGTISNAYSTSRVYGTTNGAFAGSNSGTFIGNVYNSNLEIAGVGTGNTSGLTAKTFVEMQNQSIMQSLGFTAAKGWQYTAYNTPYLGTITTDVAGGTRTVSNVDELRAGDTYYISTKNDLIALSDFLKNGADTTGVKFILSNDIDMSGVNFAPIGSSSNTFKGDFYGNGNEIQNLTINSTSDTVGLFGTVEGAHIQDVAITNANVSGSQYVGILAGFVDSNSTVENVYTTGSITDGYDVGGLVGTNNGSITSSYSTATVEGRGSVGGLVGDNTSTAVIKKSYATGNVLNGVNAGGLVGFNSGKIETSYSTGNAQASTYAGGFVGVNKGNITNSYSTGTALEATNLGGFVGYMQSGSISGSVYNLSSKLNASAAGNVAGVTGVEYNEMWNQDKMESLGFTTDKGWLYTDKLTPYLNSNVSFTNGGKVYVSQVDSFVSGEVFYISTKADLNKLAELVNNGALTIGVTFVLENDIDASGVDIIANTQDNAFQGTFSGNGNTISGLTHSLFGYTENATVRDVGVSVNINSSSSSIVGALISDDLGNTTIENTYSKGSISAGSNVGGLIGRLGDGSTLKASYSEVTVRGSTNVGGLVGVANGADIINSFASGNVTATSSYAGGLVGSLNDGASVANSYASGNVSGTKSGGLVGITSNSSITGSYSIGIVSGSSAKGFIGSVSGSNTISGNVYNNANSDNVAGAQGLSLDKMKDQSIMESYGFTSDKGWKYYEDKTPMLQDRDKVSGNSYAVDVSLDTALWMLGDVSISKNMTIVVNGNTYEKYFNESDTVEDVMNWLSGISEIDYEFDEATSKFTVTSKYEDLALSGGLTNLLFGGYGNRVEDTIVVNTESEDLMRPGDYEEITEDTTIKSLLNSNNSSVIGYIDDSGNYVTKTFEADQTVGDVMDYLESQGFEVSLVNGVFTAVKNDGAKTDLLGAIGSALKGSDGTVTSEGSGFVSDILSSTVGVAVDGSTKLSALGVDSGKIQVKSGSGAIIQTLEIDNNMTINDLAAMLSNYGFNLSVNNGKVTVTGDGDNILVNGTSNLVSKLKLDTWNKNNEELAGDSTLSEMGFSQGASLGVIVNGKNMPNLTFTANDTLDTIISRLKAYGIEASIDADGKFTAKADSSFVLTGELGSYLTQNSANGYEDFANGYKSENPVEIGGTITKLSEDTLIGDLLGTGEGGILRLTLDGDRVIDLAYNANDTVKDIMVDLEGYGISTEINNGVLTAISQDRIYRFSGEIGDALSGETPMYDDISTGYVSKDLSYEIVGTATLDSTLKELGIIAGQIHIMDSNNNIVTTLDVDDSFTVSQVKAMLMPYGLDLSMDSNGSVTVTTNNGYKIVDGTSNMVSKMGLTNWNMPTEQLNLGTTIAQMGFANGADLNLFLDGSVQNILSFDANQTLQDVIFALSAYGIDASVDANGRFTATSDAHTFVMSNSLGSFLTKGTSGYTNFDSAYETDETLTEDFDYVTSSSTILEYQKNMTLDSSLESLGFNNGGNVIVSLDGETHYTLSFLATDKVQDVIFALSAYGINATVDSNGQFFAQSVNNEFVLTGNLGTYLVSGGMYQNEDTGYQSGELGYQTVEKVTNDTKLSELGVMSGDINIIKDGKLTGSTINITADTTVGQLFNAIKVFGMTGSIKTNDAGETYIEIAADSNTYLADGTSNVVSGLGLVSVRQGDFKGENVIYWEDETDSGLITEDMLLSDFDRNGYIAQGSLIFETGTGDEAEEHIINIASDETVGSLLQKLNNTGVTAVLDNGVIKINAGIDGITFKGGTSGLVNTIGLDIEDVDVFASSSSALTYEGDVAYSAANFANGDTKLSVVNATNGEMNFFVDGIKCTVNVNSEDTFSEFFKKASDEVFNRTGLTLKAGFLNKSGEIVENPTDAENTGVVAFEIEGEHELVIGSTIDTTNFATIANLNKSGYNKVVGSRALYRVNVNSKITESGLFRDGDITEGTFKIGDAEFTIDSNTTLNSLIDQINKSQTAYATAYWDTLSGTMVIQSTLTGASLINIEAGTSNFTDILGFTEEKNGVSALVTDNQTLGKNAIISINGTKVTASSNVITSEVSKIKGLTINLKNVSEGETVTISVERDDEAIYNAVSETIDAYNAMMEALNKELSNKETLGNQALLKLMRNNLKRLMTSSLTGDYYYKNLAAIGIDTGSAQDSLTLDVTSLMIDKDQFLEALQTDDDAVKKLLVGTQANPGIFLQANNIVESSIKSTGYFNSMAESLTRSINNIEKKINQANEDIENYRTKLERNFQNMESAISSMQNSYSAFLNKVMS